MLSTIICFICRVRIVFVVCSGLRLRGGASCRLGPILAVSCGEFFRLSGGLFWRLWLLRLFGGEGAQLVELVGQDPGPRDEVKLQRIEFLQTFQILRQEGLPGDVVHGWEVIRFLVGLERGQFVRIYPDVVPIDVKLLVRVLALGHSPLHVLLGNLLNQRIFSF